ncbi:hypothetical protein NB231_14498 [Nitrococcus mobilis Nb-231]|uniref:HEPN domain-containing protein n=1 Tax=Nitrococcus mobilis Nb-231 TaxID=314278 RepID=A4BL50_9GAMM|nr:hypothetical protein NB231_14498 [Nitrococcus mobilis Nb-231]
MAAIHRAQVRDELRQADEQSLDARVDRYLEVNHAGIIGNHYFAAASSECINLYRDGHFIAAVMATQAVNEGMLKFLEERNGLCCANHDDLMKTLRQRDIMTQKCVGAAEKIWKSFRNDVHHMNPKVSTISFPELARTNLQSLAVVEGEIFGVDIVDGKLCPKQPKYWDIQSDDTVPVFLRLGI